MEQELVWSAVVAWMTSKGIQIAKRLTFIPMDETTERVNWIVSRIAAAVTAVGVHATFDHQAGVITITGVTAWGIFSAMLEYAKQLLLQEIAWSKFVKPKEQERGE